MNRVTVKFFKIIMLLLLLKNFIIIIVDLRLALDTLSMIKLSQGSLGSTNNKLKLYK